MSQLAHEQLLDQARVSVTRQDLEATISRLSAANRERPDGRLEHELRRLRHRAFPLLDPAQHQVPVSAAQAIPVDPVVGLPVVHGTISAPVVRKTIETHGSVLVRGFLNDDRVSALRDAVESALAAREELRAGGKPSAWYAEFEHIGNKATRPFTSAEGLLVADSPRGLFRLLEHFREIGVDRLAAEFLGARPVLSVEKSVFREVHPKLFAGWHQDGAFLGENIRSLDVWIALTRCGKEAPGLELVSQRIDRVLPTGMHFDWDLSEDVIAREYPDHAKVRPEFEPGDAILFDQLCAHRTGHAAGMTERRLAIECWLFAAGHLPPEYTGLVL